MKLCIFTNETFKTKVSRDKPHKINHKEKKQSYNTLENEHISGYNAEEQSKTNIKHKEEMK